MLWGEIDYDLVDFFFWKSTSWLGLYKVEFRILEIRISKRIFYRVIGFEKNLFKRRQNTTTGSYYAILSNLTL